MNKKTMLIIIILAIFCVGMTLGSVSASHTYKRGGYTFKVSDKTYSKIKEAKKNKDGLVPFKVKTNKHQTIKVPKYKTKKVSKYKWKYKKLKVSQEKYWDWEYKYYTDQTSNGWKCYKLTETDFEDGIPYTHYVHLKKKVKYKATKKVKTGYKKVKVPVYAIGHSSRFVPCVAFRAIGHGQNQFAGDGCYYPL